MRFVPDFTVGRKLAASAVLAVLLLVGLVGLVWSAASGILDQQRASARTEAAMDALDSAAATLREVAALERDLLLAPDEASQAPAWGRIAAALSAGTEASRRAAASLQAPAVTAAAERVAAGAEAYRAALQQVATHRLALIRARDLELFPRGSDYESLFESVSAGISFDVAADAQEDARQRLMTVHAAVNDTRIGIQRLLLTGEEAQLRRVRRGIAQARVHSRGLLTLEAPPRMREDIARLAERAQSVGEAAGNLLAAGEAVSAARNDLVTPARQGLYEAVAGLAGAGSAVSAAQRAAVMRHAEMARMGTLWAGLAVALVLVVSGILLTRAIGSPLRRLSGVMAQIAAGETRVEVPHRRRHDEIGAIAAALETLRATTARAFAQQQMIEQLPSAVMSADPNDDFRITYMNAETRMLLDRLRHLMPMPPEEMLGQSIDIFHRHPEHQRALLGDPTRLPHSARIRLGEEEVIELRISAIHDAAGHYTGTMLCWTPVTDQVRLADSFETEVGAVVVALADSATRLQGSAAALSGSAETSGREAAAVADAGVRAQTDVEAVAAAAEEMATSVTEIARQVSEAAAVASRAVGEARATDTTVQGLSEAAARIGDVVKLIGNIAGQTNLLALNATIEAARAGEAGKGFAVVASEVKSLAGQTARATEEIAAQIGQMQQATSQAVAAIRGIGSTVERTSDIATAIAAAVEEQGAATREIARSASQVAEATQTVASRIQGVRSAAEATGSAAAAMRDDSGTLAGQAAKLKDKTDSFLRSVRAV